MTKLQTMQRPIPLGASPTFTRSRQEVHSRFPRNMMEQRTSRRRLRSVGVLFLLLGVVQLPGAPRGQVDGRRERRQRWQLRQGVLQAERAGGQQHARDGPHHAVGAAQEALEGGVEQGNVLQPKKCEKLTFVQFSPLRLREKG